MTPKSRLSLVIVLLVGVVVVYLVIPSGGGARRSQWSGPIGLIYEAEPHYSVSACFGSNSCVVVGTYGPYNLVQGRVVTPIEGDGPIGISSVSCPPDGHCVAIGSGSATLSHGRWSPVVNIGPKSLGDVAWLQVVCASDSFCMAVGQSLELGNNSGYAALWNGHVWSHAWNLGLVAPNSLDCAAVESCVVTGNSLPKLRDNVTEVFHRDSWSVVRGSPNDATLVGCMTATQCDFYDGDDAHALWQWSNGRWLKQLVRSNKGADEVVAQDVGTGTCVNIRECLILSQSGRGLIINSAGVGTVTTIAAGLSSISCSTSGYCLGVTLSGNAYYKQFT